jgi:peptide chain release factor subunit 1
MVLCYVQVMPLQITVPSLVNDSIFGITLLFESPKKINISFYRCDNKYHLDPILDMYNDENKIGVCFISGEQLLIYSVSITGSHIEPKLIKKLNIELPNKQKKGGQSAVRFSRNADIARHQAVIKFTEHIVKAYMTDNNTKCNITKLVIGGFGYMPDDVLDTQLFKQYLSKYLYKKITLNSFDTATVHSLAKELISPIDQDLSKSTNLEIKKIIEMTPDMIGFGKNECIELLDTGNVVKLFISKSIVDLHVKDTIAQYLNNELTVIETNSSELELYGGWLCIKKYMTDYTTK